VELQHHAGGLFMIYLKSGNRNAKRGNGFTAETQRPLRGSLVSLSPISYLLSPARLGLVAAAVLALTGAAQAQSDLVITGIIDAPRTGGLPKAIEIYVVNSVADLSIYKVQSYANGGTTPSAPLALTGSATAGQYLYVASESTEFTAYFGFAPTATGSALNVNGDDVVALTKNDTVVDVFGTIGVDPNVDATFNYQDSWFYRKSNTGPSPTFNLADWTFPTGQSDALDSLGATGVNPAVGNALRMPIGTFTSGGGGTGPTISTTGTLNPFTATAGTASAAQTFSVTGANLTADITVTAPTNFEVASDGATFGSTATIAQSGGSASGTVSVRVAASAPAGAVSGSVSLASTTATGSVAVSGFVSGPVSLPYGPETFEISTGQWQTYSLASTKNWSRVTLGTDQIMQINGFDNTAGAPAADDWLILGPITVPSGISSLVANFNIQKAFTSGQDTEFNLKVSTNYTGTGDPTSATWSTVDFTKPAAVANSGVTTMDASGNVVLPSSLHGQSGVYVAFHLAATGANTTCRWSIDDFALTTTTKPPLSLTGIPATINEGVLGGTGTVSIPATVGADLVVTVESSDATELLVDGIGGATTQSTTVTIPAGSTSAIFYIDALTDNEVDADQTVTLTATVADDSYQGATVNVTVKNVDLPSASLTGTGYTETFSTFAAATPTLPLGWSATGATTTFPATGNVWNEGTSGGFRGGANVLGYQHTGSTGTLVKTLTLKNETGAAITDLTISYKGRVAQASGGRTPSYAVTVGGQAVPALAYSTADGDNTMRTASLTGLSIASGASFQISWSSDGSDTGSPGSGSRRQIGISEVSVTLGAASTAPTLSGLSIPIINVTRTQAQASASVTADGGAAITKRGFVIAATSANPNPEIGGTGVTNVEDAGTEVGLMTATFTGLSVGTGYTVKAYAINSVGTSYTTAQSFTTVGPAASFTGTYSESFDSYTGTVPAGWHAVSSTGVQVYGGEWGTGSAGGFRGTGATTGGVLGYQPTTTTGDLTVTLSLINNTGATIETLNIGYLGRVARVDQGRISSWAVTLDGQAVADLAYFTNNASGEAGAPGDETKTAQLTGLSIADGAEFTLTWTSPNPTGTGSSRQIGLADVVVSTSALNSAPTDIALSASSIAENNAVNANVGTLSTTDADAGDSFTYTLVAGTGDTDNASFNISGSALRAGVALDFETKSSYSIRVRTTDSANNTFEKQFTITVTDVVEGGFDTDAWLAGETMNSVTLGKLAIGGASSAIANDGEKPVVSVAGGQLVLSAIVRTNGPAGLAVVGEAVSSLADYGTPASITPVNGERAAVQGTVPEGCERQEFKVNQDGGRKFLRLKATLP
jgi:hypothetical protein